MEAEDSFGGCASFGPICIHATFGPLVTAESLQATVLVLNLSLRAVETCMAKTPRPRLPYLAAVRCILTQPGALPMRRVAVRAIIRPSRHSPQPLPPFTCMHEMVSHRRAQLSSLAMLNPALHRRILAPHPSRHQQIDRNASHEPHSPGLHPRMDQRLSAHDMAIPPHVALLHAHARAAAGRHMGQGHPRGIAGRVAPLDWAEKLGVDLCFSCRE